MSEWVCETEQKTIKHATLSRKADIVACKYPYRITFLDKVARKAIFRQKKTVFPMPKQALNTLNPNALTPAFAIVCCIQFVRNASPENKQDDYRAHNLWQ